MKKLTGFMILVILILFTFTASYADTITFGDDSIYWPTWSNGTLDDKIGNESIGSPEITGGGLVFEGETLNEVYFNYNKNHSSIFSGDLFIDLGSNGFWDYVVQAKTGDICTYDDGVFGLTKTDFEKFYVLSNEAYGIPSYREDHPVYASDSALELAASREVDGATVQSLFKNLIPISFSGLGIDAGGKSVTIAWAPTCANDVVYTSVPEPATMILLGSGLLGVLAFGRRKFFK
ncbi:MAG: PEP-CTERM sorting domain-containing protein [Deltaproteobacteria bacterium]|nr:PEP-CTERM sorting domain-containing protein [Deltaproteobacteria bacterium]